MGININRRDFLAFVGAGGVGTGVGFLYGESTKKTVELLLPQVVPPEDYSPGVATWYNTVCGMCSGGCGISVRIREGRAKKIEGNAVHPVNHGGLCALGQAGLNALYNPDRIKAPLKRVGERGAGEFIEISWDQALTQLGNRLGNLKINDQADRVYFLTDSVRGHLDTLISRFMQELGSPHYLQYDFTYPTNLYAANRIVYDEERLPYYDIKNADYVLSFGADYLGTWLSPLHYSHAFGQLRQGEGRHRGKCVQIEPRMSLTGASADEWLAARPGSEGLLALGVAHTIITTGLYEGADSDAWLRFVNAYSATDVSGATGVSAAAIKQLAKDFMAADRSLAIGGGAAAASTNGVANLVAINLLNYLSGSVGSQGGVLFNPEPAMPVSSDRRNASHADMLEFISAIGGGTAEVLLVHNTNPAFTLPPGANFVDALSGVPDIVSLSSFMDETTAMADLILPMHTYLETWGDDIPEPGIGVAIASISQPVVKPVFDTRSAGDVVLALGHQIGQEFPTKLPWTQMEDYLKDSWRAIYEQQKGFDSQPNFNEFWAGALQAGVWAENKPNAVRPPPGPAAGFGQSLAPASYAGDEIEYPFHLQPYLTLTFLDGRGANLPWQQELPDPMTSVVYGSWVELNPDTAADLGVSEGDVLEVSSPAGTIKAPALLFPAIRPDVVAMPIGQGHNDYGRYAKNRGANPLSILAQQVDEQSGALAWAATRVKLVVTGERVKIVKTDGVTRTLGRQILSGPHENHA